METLLAESQTNSYFPQSGQMAIQNKKDVSDTHIQKRTITKLNQDRTTALERSVKSISLEGLNRFYVVTILALTFAAVDTYFVQSAWRLPSSSVLHLREYKQSTNYRDETTMRTRQHETTEMLEQKKKQQLDSGGPNQR